MTSIRKILDIITEVENYIILYRGDSSIIKKFSLDKTDPFALFGSGIYLTDNIRVARDYTAKSASSNDGIIFRASGMKTKNEVIDRWIQDKAKWIDLDGNEITGLITWSKNALPFSNGKDWAIHDHTTEDERSIRIEHAKRLWDNIKSTVEIRKLLNGEIVIRKKDNSSTVTKFKIPVSFTNNCLYVEDEIPDDVLELISNILIRYGDRITLKDMNNFIHQYKNDGITIDGIEYGGGGFNPTFREIWRSLTSDSPLVDNSNARTEFRRGMKSLGYTGLHYSGGLTMGGIKHNAYVFWDEQFLNKCIVK